MTLIDIGFNMFILLHYLSDRFPEDKNNFYLFKEQDEEFNFNKNLDFTE